VSEREGGHHITFRAALCQEGVRCLLQDAEHKAHDIGHTKQGIGGGMYATQTHAARVTGGLREAWN